MAPFALRRARPNPFPLRRAFIRPTSAIMSLSGGGWQRGSFVIKKHTDFGTSSSPSNDTNTSGKLVTLVYNNSFGGYILCGAPPFFDCLPSSSSSRLALPALFLSSSPSSALLPVLPSSALSPPFPSSLAYYSRWLADPANPSSTLDTRAQRGLDVGQDRVYGVNLGGWFVLHRVRLLTV
ncbi:hypothetical protein MSAN_00875900 [Mycena sanguinolenta]|uniref:Uncharacterized protein n=1 Tax=Mycena sanguinolenta TaxID=230812 RepID=A0A8H7DCR0_9AGAR|nr:hypothetical protein MSAN_00875900 [Mycena sanguinolenta]